MITVFVGTLTPLILWWVVVFDVYVGLPFVVKMTVITKPISEKKADKLVEPLVENEETEGLVSAQLV
jgi:hypothetical protein